MTYVMIAQCLTLVTYTCGRCQKYGAGKIIKPLFWCHAGIEKIVSVKEVMEVLSYAG